VQRRRRTGARVALLLAVPVVLLALAQVVLPVVAARVIRDRLGRYGYVRSVHVSAWPAVELLWGKADSLSATARGLSLTGPQMTKLAWESRGVRDIDLAVDRLDVKVPGIPNGIVLRDARARKRGASMSLQATLTQADLTAALPSGFTVQPVASGGGQVEVRASGALFGAQASISALVRPLDGRLVAEPRGFPLAGFATVTLFSDPHTNVQSVGVQVIGKQPLSYGLSLTATLR
jgi:LmeA-like phospholipid-binding